MSIQISRWLRRRPFATGLLTALLIAALDGAVKWLIVTEVMVPPRVIPLTPFFNLVLGFNRGVAFGLLGNLGPWGPPLLASLVLVIVALLLSWLWRAERLPAALAVAAVLGGAIGNVVDRLEDGAVTDYLDLYLGAFHWPAFNLADVAIVLGVAALLLQSWREPAVGR